MGSSLAHIGDWRNHPGKYLSAAGYFGARLDHIADARDANFFSGGDNRHRCVLDTGVLQHHIENRAYVDVEDAVVISEAVPETNLLDWKFCEFEFHFTLSYLRTFPRPSHSQTSLNY